MSTAITHIKTERQLVPALRFPGNMGVWQEMMIGNFANVKSGYTFSREYQGLKNEKWLYLKVADIGIKSNIKYLKTAINTISEETLRNIKAKPYRKGCTIFPRVGMALLNNNKRLLYEDSLVDDNVLALDIFDIEKCDDEFIFYWFLTKHLSDFCNNGQIPVISASRVKAFHVPVPEKIEQQKIASFLSAVDEKTQLLTKKKALLEQYKKGVMQQLFSGQLRFKDENRNPYPDWVDRKLGEVLKEFVEKTTKSNQHPILSSTKKDVYLQSEYFTRDIASKDNTGYKVLKRNQLVFSPQNLWLGNININVKYDIGIVSPSYKVFDFKNDLAKVLYFKDFLLSNRMMYEYAQASEQGASVVRRNLDMPSFKAIKIQLPSIEEQQKIATYLARIDTKIESVNNQITQTQTFKKGLLQQMFV